MSLFRLRSSLFLLIASGMLVSGFASADPSNPVAVTRPPEDQGAAFIPGVRLVANLAVEYVEEEFFVEGEAALFNYANNPPLGPTDIVPVGGDLPYKTRLIVRRPADPADFNGTVVVEWWNSTAGFDTAPVWDPSADYFARTGVIYVGVTNSNQALSFLTGGCRAFGILPPSCGTRYSSLSLPDDGLVNEALSQIATALRGDDSSNPIPAEYNVRRLYHAGQSQQAGSMVTYASAFHLPGVNDGYFIQSGINARSINGGQRCGTEGAPVFPGCTPQLAPLDRRVRTDLPVPVFQTVTQTDFEALGFNVFGRQSDTPTFRYYEIAGGSHNTVHIDIELIPAGIFGPTPVFIEDLCANDLNTTADGPVFVSFVLNSLWDQLQRQTRFPWRRAPRGVLMDDIDGVLQTDELGNVTGGVRLPSVDAPVALYTAANTADPTLPPALQGIGALACRLSGSVFPFDEATLDELYPRRFSRFFDVWRSTFRLRRQGLLLREDAFTLLIDALRNPVGGGGGY